MHKIEAFKGLNNVSDPLRLGMSWLAQADNLDITDTGAISKRGGYVLDTAGSYAGAFSTFDFARMYVVVNGELRTKEGAVLLTDLPSAPMYWTEVNNQVFFNNGTDSGIINPDHSLDIWRWPTTPASLDSNEAYTYLLPDGRMTGTVAEVPPGFQRVVYTRQAQPNEEDHQFGTVSSTTYTNPDYGVMRTENLDPLPEGADVVAHWKGRMYAAEYMAGADQTVIWFSEPLGYHLFNLNSNFIMVPGHVLLLAAANDALLVGTESRIYAYDGTKLDQLAAYGVVPGQHACADGDAMYFWSTRGLCSAMPFTNLTERNVSVAPGVRAGGCIVRDGGQRRYLAVLQQGGQPFNAY